jgi:hypothetical protein
VRTTLTLDDDVAAKLRAEAKSSGRSFKEIVNDFLRRGLSSRGRPDSLSRFEVKARSWGKPGFNYDRVWEIIEQLEGPLYR